MQFRLSLPLAATVSASGFKQGLSSILAGLTIAGAFSTVIFTTSITNNPLSNALDPIKKALASTPLYEGILRTAGTLKAWGASIVSSKDAFSDWFKRYFGAEGLKTGVAQLYQKLRDWAEIVYRWFKDKFWTFINNIPKMVKNWDKLRLSLFKWGTFLGGGGGSALWAMFGSGENLGKLGELLNNPEFGEIAEKFSKLLEDNNSAFNEMSEEEAKEIFESILDDPEEAKDTIDKLLKEQEELNKDKPKEAKVPEENQMQEEQLAEEKQEQKELSKDRISEAFSKGGSPKSPKAVFQNMIGGGMQKLVDLSNSFFGDNLHNTAKKAMQDYVDKIRKELENKEVKTKSDQAKQKFIKALENDKDKTFIESLTDSLVKAFHRAERKGKVEFKNLSESLGEVLEESYTKPCPECGEKDGVSLREEVPKEAPIKKKVK